MKNRTRTFKIEGIKFKERISTDPSGRITMRSIVGWDGVYRMLVKKELENRELQIGDVFFMNYSGEELLCIRTGRTLPKPPWV